MSNIEWNDGMSVGVESIDEDHKTLLLLINEINDAINNGSTHLVIIGIFEKLEKHVKKHFSKEELLLEQCNYGDIEEHKQQHLDFLNKIHELRDKLLHSDTVEVAKEVHLFLFNWLMTHIIIDDMSYAQTVHDNGLATTSKTKNSFLSQLLCNIGQKITLNKRIFLSAFVPIISFMSLCIFIFWQSFVHYNSAQQLLGLSGAIRNINNLSHNLQIERDLSSQYISSNYQENYTRLTEQRFNTDTALNNYEKNLSLLSPPLINDGMQLYINESKGLLVSLNEKRQTIDEQLSNVNNMQKYYQSTIETLLNLYDGMILLDIEGDFSRNITVISVIIDLKEAVRKERALGMNLLENQEYDKYQLFFQLIGKQEGLSRTYNSLTSNQKNIEWKQLDSSKEFNVVKQIEADIIRSSTDKTQIEISSEQWFKSMTSKIDLLEQLTKQLVVNTETSINETIDYQQQLAYSIAIILLFIIIMTLVISWLLAKSIIFPIRRITKAMIHLSQGYRNLRFTNHFAHDEISNIINAYEYSRRKLLQADIAATLTTVKLTIFEDQKEDEKEIPLSFSSLDRLTGVMNRRKFNELAEHELMRVKRYKHGLALMIIDIDNFKKVNDTYGLATGDRVLQELCQVCNANVRNTDIFARIGGEEFVILMPETKIQQAHALAERICTSVENHTVIINDTKIKFSVSVGVTAWDESIGVMSYLLEKAEKAVYAAKVDGQNRVVIK
ncbi:bacteriohemerythrin [Candidatus Colwellia aromaticivorans]|uniref:bacteriohemerythrin n=1 Tax=Candidatus Colwellia aromaticivorans TaxID=2267621 RepID=UPI000DF21C05|nr:bacteriohemerythrin [Candidatus Colwellia aromaticivorans]